MSSIPLLQQDLDNEFELSEKEHSSETTPPKPLLPTSLLQPSSELELENLEISRRIYTLFGRGCSLLGPRWVRAVGYALLPTFLRNGGQTTKIHPTSWLDGLRGLASFFVFYHHILLIWFPALSYGYGSSLEHRWFVQLPFLRIVYAGRGMVTIFFVVSGYALSYSSLRKIRNGEFDKVLDTLASSVFRRWIRLFTPILVSSFITVPFTKWNFYQDAGLHTILPQNLPTYTAQISDWWENFILLSNPFLGIGGEDIYQDPYGSQLWTIPRELRGSLVIYLTLLGLAKTKQAFRLSAMIGLSLYTLYLAQWDIYLFLSGATLAEIQLLSNDLSRNNAFSSSKLIPSTIKQHKTPLMHFVTITSTLLAIHLLTYPDEGDTTTPGYSTLLTSVPSQYSSINLRARYWLCHGAVLLCFALAFSPGTYSNPIPLLQRPFNTAFVQYLAKISYALYVVHLHLVWTIGYRMMKIAGGLGAVSYFLRFLETGLLVGTLGFWTADIFWREVDARSVLFAKWVAGVCFVK